MSRGTSCRIRILSAFVLFGFVACSGPSKDGDGGGGGPTSDTSAADTRTVDDPATDGSSDMSSGPDSTSIDSGRDTSESPSDGGVDTGENGGTSDTSDGPSDSGDTSEAPDSSDTCTPDCNGKDCGSNGCGGTCGSCDPGQECDSNQQCVCKPDCSGKQCGGDGCGGKCGPCPDGNVCRSNQCETVSFENDVMPLITSYGCAAGACHDSQRPKAGLDLSSKQTAYNNLVGVSAQQCSSRKRVESGAPANSYLIDKLEGQNLCFGNRMPSGGPYLSSSEIDTIRAWISGGAPNN